MGLKAKWNGKDAYVKVEIMRVKKGFLNFAFGRYGGCSSSGKTIDELEKDKYNLGVSYAIYDKKGGDVLSQGEFVVEYNLDENPFTAAYNKLKLVNPDLSEISDA